MVPKHRRQTIGWRPDGGTQAACKGTRLSASQNPVFVHRVLWDRQVVHFQVDFAMHCSESEVSMCFCTWREVEGPRPPGPVNQG